MDVRIEGIALLSVGLQPVLAGHPLELVGHRLETTGQLAVLAGRADIVQDVQQVLEQTLDRWSSGSDPGRGRPGACS